jgi:predicted dinucleotide-binding enzyme
MKIGILGSGNVGQTLGSGFVAAGHEVKIGSRDPRKAAIQEWVRQAGAGASAGTFAETAAFADLALLATLWTGTESAIHLAGAANLDGKVVIDLVNPLVFPPAGPPTLALGHTDSAGEQVQRWLPRARVVKAFNTVGAAHMVHPDFPGGPPDMFICGNDEAAKQTVSELCGQLGWPTVDLGGIESSRLLEPMCVVWVLHGISSGSFNHAFKLLRK